MEDEIIIHRQIINHYSRPDLAPQLWNYSSTLANNNNRLYWVEQGKEWGDIERRREWQKTRRKERVVSAGEICYSSTERGLIPCQLNLLYSRYNQIMSWLPFTSDDILTYTTIIRPPHPPDHDSDNESTFDIETEPHFGLLQWSSACIWRSTWSKHLSRHGAMAPSITVVFYFPAGDDKEGCESKKTDSGCHIRQSCCW